MNEDNLFTKRIAIVIIALLLCSLIALLLCLGIANFYSSEHPLISGIFLAAQTIILYLLIKHTNIMAFMQNRLFWGQSNEPPTQRQRDDKQSSISRKYTRDEVENLIAEKIQKLVNEGELFFRKEIEENYISKERFEELQRIIEKLKKNLREDYVPKEEYDKVYIEKRLFDTICNKTKGLLDDFTLSDDQELLISLLEKINVYFELMHYEKGKEEYFDEELIRPRMDFDPQDRDIIETCPALSLKSEYVEEDIKEKYPALLLKSACVIKGKYVKIVDIKNE